MSEVPSDLLDCKSVQVDRRLVDVPSIVLRESGAGWASDPLVVFSDSGSLKLTVVFPPRDFIWLVCHVVGVVSTSGDGDRCVMRNVESIELQLHIVWCVGDLLSMLFAVHVARIDRAGSVWLEERIDLSVSWRRLLRELHCCDDVLRDPLI